MRAFLDDTAQIIGPKFEFGGEIPGRSEREKEIARFVLDKAELIFEKAKKLGGVKYINSFEAFLQHRVYLMKYSKAEEGKNKREGDHSLEYSPEETALRQSLADWGNRLVEKGLVQGTWGNLSLRLSEEEMLVTPSGIDYERITAKDIMKVKLSSLEYEENGSLKPTSEKNLHAAIYLSRKDVNAIVHTHSSFCSVYAAAEKDMPFEGGLIRLAPYGIPGSKKLAENTAKALGEGIGAIMSHHGMVACGGSLEEAFENACRLEESAEEQLS